MEFLPLKQMNQRIVMDSSDSDSTLFQSLLLKGELITKLAIAGLVAVIPDDTDRHKYTHLYDLVRANGVGDWTKVLRGGLVCLNSAARFDKWNRAAVR